VEDTHSLHPRVTGLRQTQKAVAKGLAARVYLACDADPALTEPLAQLCRRAGIPVEQGMTMSRLGQACRIDVGCAAAAELKPR
jgi:large subunit ribosomal protein L7A